MEMKRASTKTRSGKLWRTPGTSIGQSVWGWRKDLYAAIKPLKKAAYKIFRSDPEKVDRAEFDLKSRV